VEGATKTQRPGVLNDDRWQSILDVAAQVFFEKGYQGATMQEIAARCGLLKGSLYYYIHTKEDLLYEISRRVHVDLVEVLVEPPEIAIADAPTRLSSLIERWMQMVSQAHPWGAYSTVEREFRSLSDERRLEMHEYRRRLREFIASILEQGARDGDFDPDIDAAVVVNNIGQLLWTTPSWYRDDGTRSLADITRWYQRLFLRGVSALEASGDVS
jgi:AcrR family transcriptional regulator